MSPLKKGKINWKYILIIGFLALLIGGAIFVWALLPKGLPEKVEKGPTEEEVVTLLRSLKKETGINFSQIEEAEVFRSYAGAGEMGMNVETFYRGKGFEAKGISNKQYGNIESFFKEKGFKVDAPTYKRYEQSFTGKREEEGVLEETTGYRKGKIFCTLESHAGGYKFVSHDSKRIPPETVKRDINVRCGG